MSKIYKLMYIPYGEIVKYKNSSGKWEDVYQNTLESIENTITYFSLHTSDYFPLNIPFLGACKEEFEIVEEEV